MLQVQYHASNDTHSLGAGAVACAGCLLCCDGDLIVVAFACDGDDVDSFFLFINPTFSFTV